MVNDQEDQTITKSMKHLKSFNLVESRKGYADTTGFNGKTIESMTEGDVNGDGSVLIKFTDGTYCHNQGDSYSGMGGVEISGVLKEAPEDFESINDFMLAHNNSASAKKTGKTSDEDEDIRDLDDFTGASDDL